MPLFRKRTEPRPEYVELGKAMRDLKTVLRPVVVPPIERLLVWLDRQLRRSPRLYRWLSK